MKNLKNSYTWLLALLLALALGALPATGMAASSKASKMLLIRETVGQPPSYPTSFNVYTSAPEYTAAWGLSLNIAAAQEKAIAANITQIQPIPAVDGSGNPLLQSDLLANAGAVFTAQTADIIANLMAQYMQTAGAATAILNFQQQVMVQGNSQPMYLVWQLIVDGSGRPRYGDAQLIPSVPNFVYADYTSKAVAAALPPSFAYPQAGTVQWQQVNQQMAPVTAMQTINVNGAFDAPTADATASVYPAGCTQSGGQVSCDPDYGLKCLIDHTSDPYSAASPNPANPSDTGCPAVPINGYSDFKSLMNANGASAGFVDYVQSLAPQYTTSTDSSGNTIQTALVDVSVDTRTWSGGGYSNCPFVVNSSNDWQQPSYSVSVTCTDAGGNSVVFIGTNDAYQYTQPWPGEIDTDSSEVSPVQAAFGSAVVTILSMSDSTDGIADVSVSGGGSGNSSATYTNTGRIGYAVQSTANRYYVQSGGAYTLMGSVTNPTLAPTQNYSKTDTLPSGADSAGYAYLIIDPFHTTQTYDYRNDPVNLLPASDYLYVAPIVTQ